MPREAIWQLPYDRVRWLLGLGTLVACVLSTLTVVAFLASFVWPRSDVGDPRATIDVGRAADYREGEPVFVQEGRLWLVRRTGGSFVAFAAADSFQGCTVVWRADFEHTDPRDGVRKRGWYRDPCHGSVYDPDGTKVFGPSPRDLDRYPAEVMGGRVIVRAAERHQQPGAANPDLQPFGPMR